jgi:P-type Ca2+ transporter type 2C
MPKSSALWQSGLTSKQVSQQRRQFGENFIPHRPPPSDLYFFLVQFKNPLVIVLLAALVITFFLKEFTDSAVIGLAVMVNTILGFVQERKAYKTLESLKTVLTPHAWVIRNNQEKEITVEEIVPGDIVLLKQGDKVPADGVIIYEIDCWINESIITGESEPVQKQSFQIARGVKDLFSLAMHLQESTKLPEEIQVFMGAVVATGSATMIVTHTGAKTTLGKIAHEVQQQEHTETPLAKRLSKLAEWLTIMVIILSALIFLLGLSTGKDLIEMFTITVALAVAAIPEGLVVSLTAVLALGMHRILKRKAVVKHLMAAETLGSVNTICLDKTGTLTEGKLKVVQTDFIDVGQAQLAAVLANDRRDPLDLSRMNWAREQAKQNSHLSDPEKILSQHKDLQLLSFCTDRCFVAAQAKFELFMVGAPEVVMNLSKLSESKQKHYQKTIKEWTQQGWRVIGFASRHYAQHQQSEAAFASLRKNKAPQHKLGFLGLMAFSDPVRSGIAETLQIASQAGLKPIVITGDYAATAQAIMSQIGLEVTKDEIMTGGELEKISSTQLKKKINQIKLFARTKPAQKLQIVKLLQEEDRVVGMMGDGVNDAPALSAADIGIVVDDASEVAREAADLVLLKNDFSTVLAAIEEGRLIFSNLRKITLYLLSDTFSELLLVIGSLVLRLPLPITAAQILWINLIDDGLPNLALTLDPPDGDELKRQPIKHNAPIINSEMRILIAVISLLTGGGLLILFMWLEPQIGLITARTIIFATLSMDSLLYVLSSRSLSTSIIHDPPWRNPWLLGACGVGVLLTIAAVEMPFFQRLFGMTSLSLQQWGLVTGMSLLVLVLVELIKLIWISKRVSD